MELPRGQTVALACGAMRGRWVSASVFEGVYGKHAFRAGDASKAIASSSFRKQLCLSYREERS